MRADWMECGLTNDAQSADILLDLTGTQEEIEQVRTLARETKRWSAQLSGRNGVIDRIVLKVEEVRDRWTPSTTLS